jgi:AcrR family transcriptional regulator
MQNPAELPVEPPLLERRRQATMAEISAVAADLFLARGAAGTTVASIAAAAGVSTRTFHRYFATKTDALGPVLQEGLQRYLDAVSAMPATSEADDLVTELVDALASTLGDPHAARDEALLRLVLSTPELESVWLRMHEECAMAMVPVLAARLPGTHDALSLRFLSGSVVMANRLAVEEWVRAGGDARRHMERSLDLLRRPLASTDSATG